MTGDRQAPSVDGLDVDDPLDCEVVTTRSGARAVRDRRTGELMHPVVGPLVEAERLYVTPSRLRERLAGPEPLVLLDVGLGAASNAIAAWKASAERSGGPPLTIVSFDHSLGALRVALEHGAELGFEGASLEAARALLHRGEHDAGHTRWRFVPGALPGTLAEVPDASADLVFWDPFSPRSNPGLWTAGAFRALRRACRRGATVCTYSGATSTRSAMILGGFAVGIGVSTGDNKFATIGAVDVEDAPSPLDGRWLERLTRSSAPFPSDAPTDALDQIRAAAQFNRGA